MEENTQSSTPTPSSGGNKNTMIAMAVGAVAVVVLVVLGVVFLFNGSSAGLTALNPGNPDEANAILNSSLKDVVLQIAKAESEADLPQIEGLEKFNIEVEFDISDTAGDVTVSLSGDLDNSDASNPKFAGDLTISGAIPGAFEFASPFKADIVAVDSVLYFNMAGIPEEIASQIVVLGITEGVWYSVPMDSDAGSVTDALTAMFDKGDIAELEERFANNDLFINPRSADDREVSGVNTKCMIVDPNPDIEEAETTSEPTPLEICSPEGSFLPFFLGAEATEAGANYSVGISLSEFNSGAEFTAPADHSSLEALLSAFSGQ